MLILFVVGMPTLALDYKTPPEKMTQEVLSESVQENDIVKIEKLGYKFKYCRRFGKGYGYEISNKTSDDVLLIGVESGEFFNKDVNGLRISPIKYIIMGNFTTGFSYIPYYGMYYRLKVTQEERMFLRDFPKEISISPEKKLRMLLSAPKKSTNPQSKFLFRQAENDFDMTF